MHNMTPLPPPQPLRVARISGTDTGNRTHGDHQDRHDPAARHRRFSIFKPASERRRAGDSSPATPWSNLLATRRMLVQRALASIAEKPNDAAVQYYERKVAHISVAMYLLCLANDLIREIPDHVPSVSYPHLLSLVNLLDKPYFTEPYGIPAFQYEAIQTVLAKPGFGVLNADDAAKKYVKHVKKRITQMRKSRQGVPKDVDIIA